MTAAVSPDEAAKLGSSLTPIGAQKEGNADGSIPAWTGGLAASAGKVDGKGFLPIPLPTRSRCSPSPRRTSSNTRTSSPTASWRCSRATRKPTGSRCTRPIARWPCRPRSTRRSGRAR
ncbi:hypothetical protein ACPA9J_30810 [Pseudomonas aeruginosa]